MGTQTSEPILAGAKVSDTALYQMCGFTIESGIPLPELLPARGREAVCAFRVLDDQPPEPAPSQWFHHWRVSNGEVCLSFAKHDDGYLLRFPDIADFSVSADAKEIRCFPKTCIPANTIRHLFLNQVIPLILSRLGRLVVHASAVVTSHGAIAFVGMAGAGKSTLAASFAKDGFPLLTDDCLLLDENDGRLLVHPSYPGLRLWDDAVSALFGDTPMLFPVAHYTDKKRLRLSEEQLPFYTDVVELKRMYVLDSSRRTGREEPVDIFPLSAREAFMELVSYSYKLDITDHARLKDEFERLERIVARPLCYCLKYPRDLSLLPAVREAILTHLGEE